jgi:hypothetical protein
MEHRQHVIAVDAGRGKTIGAGAVGHASYRGSGPEGRAHSIMVVLAHKNNGEAQDSGQVERFVEDTSSHGAVTEECHADLIGFFDAACQRCTTGNGKPIPDNCIGAQIASLDIGDVHRTALASTVAVLAAVDFGHHVLEFGALGDAVTVAPMCTGDIVIWTQGKA